MSSPPPACRVLVVEDDEAIRANVVEHLSRSGLAVREAGDGVTGLALATSGSFQVVVLDLELPRLGGLEVARGLRTARGPSVAVLMLTARDSLEDKLAGFEAGADDYLVKPFALAELEVRVRALAQRISPPPPRAAAIQFEDLELDAGAWQAVRGGRILELNRIGFTLLRALLERQPEVLTRADCEKLLWDGFSPGGSVLRTHIYALRRELDRDGETPLLETVRGVGYRLVRG